MIRAALAALLTVNAGAQVAKKVVMPMEWKGAFCHADSPAALVVERPEQWALVWSRIGKPAPQVDLDKYFAVALFAGQRPTGGYSFAWEKPVDRGDETVVRYRLREPKGMVIQAITRPWDVRLFPRTG